MREPTLDIRLAEGESVLWQGRPQMRAGAGQWWSLHLSALLMLAVVVWSFTDAAPEAGPLRPLHDAAMLLPIRIACGSFALLFALMPLFLARQTNRARYIITTQRVVILSASGHRDETPYREMSNPRVQPMGQGLATLRFSVRADSSAERDLTTNMLYAIPHPIAERAALCARQARP